MEVSQALLSSLASEESRAVPTWQVVHTSEEEPCRSSVGERASELDV